MTARLDAHWPRYATQAPSQRDKACPEVRVHTLGAAPVCMAFQRVLGGVW